MSRLCLIALAAAMACTSKSDGAAAKAPPSKREVHEGIASSRLPGARGVGGALAVSDSATARAATIDSASVAP